ncbi:carboxypeptidase regulatory-like domain-containing protein [bacterium]|nr:carboxypeptidase regulatory-like domain-containing protein [bacterium]MCI0603802.1 carboxypeptidase regulatory-like domain-containing protein [bacterium]
MKRLFFATLCCLIFSGTLDAGTIRGRVRAESRPEVKEDIESGKYESRKYKFIERINYDELKDFVVYIDEPGLGLSHRQDNTLKVIIQKDGTFRPHVLPVLIGTTVEWPNNDDIYHNVFSMSEPKPFDLGIYKSKETKRVTFDKPGRVDVFCSIHTKMNCIVLVLENPFFAATDKSGNFTIANVPAGTYQIRAWHERLPGQVKNITVTETGESTVQFVLGVTGLPKY